MPPRPRPVGSTGREGPGGESRLRVRGTTTAQAPFGEACGRTAAALLALPCLVIADVAELSTLTLLVLDADVADSPPGETGFTVE